MESTVATTTGRVGARNYVPVGQGVTIRGQPPFDRGARSRDLGRKQTSSSERKVRPRRRWRLRLVVVLLGLVLGAAGILFCSRVYNPFGDSVESPLVLIPDDMDFVVYVPDFPTFMGEVRERDFVTALDGHPGFQGFLKTKGARESGLVDTLRKVFRSLDDAAGRVPLGLELMGDVSGTEVIVAGYFPEKKDGELRFMAVFQPGAWKTIAGVNILLDETLCDWFVSDALEAEGIGIEHRRDQVKLAFPDWNQDLWITRIADTVLVSTEERQLARIHGAVLKDGLPESPAPRYFPLQNASGDFHAQVLARRRKADTYLELEKQLLDLWGPEDLDLVELHDCFATAEVLHYENLGLCADGGAGKLIDEKATWIGGKIPVNLSGGLLSKGHPIGATGIANMYEIAMHLRGGAGKRQVEGARLGLAHVIGLGTCCGIHILEGPSN